MSFLNMLGTVSRHGQWRLRLTLRTTLPTGLLDLSDAGLIDFSEASDLVLTVTPRDPRPRWGWCGSPHGLTASMAAGTLLVANPGFVEALFPDGWGRCVAPGLHDVRLLMTVGPETALIFDEPVALR